MRELSAGRVEQLTIHTHSTASRAELNFILRRCEHLCFALDMPVVLGCVARLTN